MNVVPSGVWKLLPKMNQTCGCGQQKMRSLLISFDFPTMSSKEAQSLKTMSPKEKSKFGDQAKQDTARYDLEMMSYGPPVKRVKKDPSVPERPPSGFFNFCAEQHPKIKAQHPSFGVGDVAKKLREMWNNLTDSNKQPYIAKANKLKEKYQKDVADYNGGKWELGGAGDDEDDDEEDEDD
ncbi:high mobility group protein B3-like [Salvelinus alpinus]|uniref:high mobility group protein B3-like n=1 Tax=Salvelinus alpinus TaxID=8036 RepID=UPI0039FD9095